MNIRRLSISVLSVMLSLLMLLGMAPMTAFAAQSDLTSTGVAYELWLGSTQVTSSNQYDIFGTGQARFDPDTNTLTLSNPSIRGVYTDNSGATYKIASKNTDLKIKGTYKMNSAEAQYGVASIGGALTLAGDFAFTGTDVGVYAYDNVNVDSGTLTAVGANRYGVRSALGNVRLEPDAQKIDARGGDTAIISGEFEGYTLLLGGELCITEPANGKIKKENSGSEYIIKPDGSKATRAVIEPLKLYDVWLGDTRVTNSNAADIFGDGKAKYSPIDRILTLSDPVITGSYTDSSSKTYKIFSSDYGLTLKGSYHMTSADAQCGVGTSSGRLAFIGDFTFMGTRNGVYSKYDIDVKSGAIKAVGSSNIGMLSEQGYIMLESMVTRAEAIGGVAAMFAEGDILYLSEDHRIVTPEGGAFVDRYMREANGATVANRVLIESITKYGLWLGETQVTSENAADIFGDGKAVFDASTGTLTLSEPTIPGIVSRGSYTYKIYADGLDLTVKGTYRMYDAEADWGVVSDYGDLTLDGNFTFFGGSKSAIACNQNLTLNGNITAYGGDNCVMAYENITVGGGYLNFYNSDIGIFSYKKLTFKGDSAMIVIYADDKAVSAASVEIVNTGDEHLMIRNPYDGAISAAGDTIVDDQGNIAKTVMLSQPMKYALWVGSVQVSDLNRKDIFGDGKAYFNAMTNTLTLNDAYVPGYSTDSYGRTHKIYASNLYLTIKGSYHMGWSETTHGLTADRGTVVLEGSFTFRGYRNGVYADSDVIVRNGSLRAFGDQGTGIYGGNNLYVFENVPFIEIQGGEKAVNFITGGLSLMGDMTVVNPAGAVYKNSTLYESNGSTIAKYAYIKPVKKYNLWVGNKQVTDENKNNICGDGKASFDPATGVLTLNDAYVTGVWEDASGIGTKFYAEGFDLTVKGSYHMAYSDTQIGIEVSNGKLTLDGDFAFRGTYVGLMARDSASVTLTGKLLLQGGSHNGVCAYGGDLIIKDAELTAYAGYYGITADGGVKVTGDSTVTLDGGIAALSGAASLTLGSGLGITDPERAVFSAGDKTVLNSDSQKAKHVVIEKTPAAARLLGDADGDGTISILDVTVIQRYLANYTVNDPESVELYGDINGKGLDIVDAALIQRYLANYTVPFPIAQPLA